MKDPLLKNSLINLAVTLFFITVAIIGTVLIVELNAAAEACNAAG